MNRFTNNRYKPILIAALLLISAGIATAQENMLPKAELSVYLKGPSSKLRIEMSDNAANNSRFSAGFGVQYSRYLAPAWSISGGLEYLPYRSEVLLHGLSDTYTLTDAEGDDMEFRSSATSYREWQSVGMINIPLKIQWETKGKTTRLFSAAGFQLGVPAFANYRGTAFGLKTSGYFPQWDVELTSPEFMGFGSWGNQQSTKQKLKLKPSCSFLLELGFKQQLAAKHFLYVSAYAEIGLNDLAKATHPAEALIAYDLNNPTAFRYNSLANAASQSTGTDYVQKITTQSFGVKMRYAFTW